MSAVNAQIDETLSPQGYGGNISRGIQVRNETAERKKYDQIVQDIDLSMYHLSTRLQQADRGDEFEELFLDVYERDYASAARRASRLAQDADPAVANNARLIYNRLSGA